MKNFIIVFLLFISNFAVSQSGSFKIGLLKYNGGGDWYANLETSLPNLVKYCNQKLKMNISEEQAVVEVGSSDIYNYPLVHITGHGNIILNQSEIDNLRNYLIAGGFLHISDNYGLDKFIRPQMKKVFPELDFAEIPFNHPIYHQTFDFPNGLPKIHEHNEKPAQGFGLFYEGRLVCFYDYECDLGDGWESPEVHGDSKDARETALQMGANMIQFVMMGDKNN